MDFFPAKYSWARRVTSFLLSFLFLTFLSPHQTCLLFCNISTGAKVKPQPGELGRSHRGEESSFGCWVQRRWTLNQPLHRSDAVSVTPQRSCSRESHRSCSVMLCLRHSLLQTMAPQTCEDNGHLQTPLQPLLRLSLPRLSPSLGPCLSFGL